MTGHERVLANNVMQGTNGVNFAADSGDAQVAVSVSGTLAYVSGGEARDINRRLVWVDRQGRIAPVAVPPKPYYIARLSPDGRWVALHTLQSDRRIWVHDLTRPDSLMALTPSGAGPTGAIWSPDGEEVAFGQIGTPDARMFRTRADGAQRQPEPLGPMATGGRYSVMGPSSWGRNGQLIFVTYGQGRLHDIWLLSGLERTPSARPLFTEAWAEQWPALSPDGQWLAYGSAETGRDQVFLVRFPNLTNRAPLTNQRSTCPVWARDGRTLYYLQGGPVGGSELVEHGIRPDGEPAAQARVLFRLEPLRLLRNQPITSFAGVTSGEAC